MTGGTTINRAAPDQSATCSDTAILIARQSLYRFAALSLLDPRVGAWERLNALRGNPLLGEAAALVRELPDAIHAQLGLGERPIVDLDPARVLAELPASPQRLNQQYENTFGLLVSNACPPYETEYINSKFAFQRSNTLADVSGFYRAFGLRVSEAHPERPDHIVMELEFMATVIGLERQAAGDGEPAGDERMQVCREAQSRFFEQHLAWWVPAFAKLLQREDRYGFYAAVGTFLSALIPVERARFGVESPSQAIVPHSVERPETCEGCALIV